MTDIPGNLLTRPELNPKFVLPSWNDDACQ